MRTAPWICEPRHMSPRGQGMKPLWMTECPEKGTHEVVYRDESHEGGMTIAYLCRTHFDHALAYLPGNGREIVGARPHGIEAPTKENH